MIEEFNKSALSRVINYNEPMAEALADNLYEKIRQSGILAEYIERNKEVRTKVNAIDASTEAPVFRADSRFTFGYCYCGTRLISPRELNIGKIWQIEFDFLYEDVNFGTCSFLDDYIQISDQGYISVGGVIFSGYSLPINQLLKIKIIRNNFMCSVFCGEVNVGGTTKLLNDNEVTFTDIYNAGDIIIEPPDTKVLSVEAHDALSEGVAITVDTIDINGYKNGVVPFTRTYNLDTIITLTAPAVSGSVYFREWFIGVNPSSDNTISTQMVDDITATVEYDSIPVGSITVTKHIQDGSEPVQAFEFTLTGALGYSQTQTAYVESPIVFSNLPLDTYTLSEEPVLNFPLLSITPNPITITELDLNQSVEVVNNHIGYGALYNWYAIDDSREIANTGWSLPTVRNWADLELACGGRSVAGGHLKMAGLVDWNSPNTGADNSFGFNGKGCGLRVKTGEFIYMKSYGYLWMSDEYSPVRGYATYLTNSSASTVAPYSVDKDFGFSVRLVKDSTTLLDGETGTYTGNDGTVYNTVCIGGREWMSEYLKETKFRTLEDIPVSTSWVGLTTSAMCYYNNDIINA